MPHFEPNTPTEAHEFLGVPIAVPYLFAEGDTLTGPEALFLNRKVATEVGNQYAGEVRRKLAAINKNRAEAHRAKTYDGPRDEKGKPALATIADLDWDHAERFASRFASFTLGVSQRAQPGSGTHGAIARMAHTIAAAKVKEAIAAKGLKISTFHASKNADGLSKFNELVAAYIERNEWVTALAEQQVAALATQGVDDELLEDIEEQPPLEAAA